MIVTIDNFITGILVVCLIFTVLLIADWLINGDD